MRRAEKFEADGLTPQKRWSRKHDYIAKSFSMYRSLADDFKKACEKAGKPQGTVIKELMTEFIRSQEG